MEINGFKIFNKDMTNSNGVHFEINKTYCVSGKLKYGPEGNGIHFCKRLEDTLRFMNGKEGIICSVISKGDIVENNRLEDDYYGYFDMYATNKLFIKKILERKEIINYFLKMNNYYDIRIDKFLRGYKLTEQEIALFKLKFKNMDHILKTISYYQEGNMDAYKLSSSKTENIKCLIKDKK